MEVQHWESHSWFSTIHQSVKRVKCEIVYKFLVHIRMMRTEKVWFMFRLNEVLRFYSHIYDNNVIYAFYMYSLVIFVFKKRR